MPMRARFLNSHNLVWVLAISLPLIAARPACATPVAEGGAELQSTSSLAGANQRTEPQAWFAKGQTALQAGAVRVLEPLWPEKSGDVLYLYLIDIAAVESGQKELDEKILSRMIAVGGGTPEFHLIMGKAFLNRYEVGEAKAELECAAEGNPDLPFLHLNLGITYMRSGEHERAEAEFRRDIALEPDLADNYEQLGVLYARST